MLHLKRRSAVAAALSGFVVASVLAAPAFVAGQASATASTATSTRSASLVQTATTARFHVTTKATPRVLEEIDDFVISGKVTPRAPGAKVKLQRLSSGHWKTVSTHRLSSTSHYRFARTTWNTGSVKWRVLKPATGKRLAGASKTVTVRTVEYGSLSSSSGSPSTGSSSGDGYYNSDGVWVPSPGSSSSGASARCNDGSYSYSTHRSGTCSGHGGVDVWL